MRTMLKRVPLLALCVMLTASLAAVGCSGDSGSCPAGKYECEDGSCKTCCTDKHCGADEECNEEGICVKACKEKTQACNNDCCENLVCDLFSKTCVDMCSTEQEPDQSCIDSHPDVDFNDSLTCTDSGLCDFGHCYVDENCQPGMVCFNRNCVITPNCDKIASCKVVPGKVVTQYGSKVALAATAYLSSGALAPGIGFDWEPDSGDVATVDNNGVVTGGSGTGSVTITATVSKGVESCQTNCQAAVTNYGAVEQGTRVVAINEMTGEPIEGANVVLKGEGIDELPDTTDASGIATFDVELSDTAPGHVTLHHGDYGYVTFIYAESNDLLAHLGETPDPNMAGGYRGKFDLSKVACEGTCEVEVGLTAPSIPGNLFNLNVDTLIGEMVGITLVGNTISVPAGLAIGVNNAWIKEEYYPTGVEGTRVAWALGGKLSMIELTALITLLMAKPVDIGQVLTSARPLLAKFYTGLQPNVKIEPIRKLIEAELNKDLNNDDDKDDIFIDWTNFPALPQGDMVLNIPMDQTLTVKMPELLPSCDVNCWHFDGVIVLAALLVRDAGLVPLGLGAGLDAPEEQPVPDGTIADIVVKVSEVAGRLPEGSYKRVVVALALNLAKLTAENNTDPLVIAGQVRFLDEDETFNTAVTLNAFMEPAVYTPRIIDTRIEDVTIDALPEGIDYVQMLASGDEGSWHALAPPALGKVDFTLLGPDPDKRTNTVGLVAIKLNQDVAGEKYQTLITFNDTNMADLVELVSDFVITYDDAGSGASPDCATGGAKGGLLPLLAMAGIALLRRRRR